MTRKFCFTLLVALATLSPASANAADPAWFQTPEPQGTGARTITVTSGQSLQDAFNKAQPGDIVEIAQGEYKASNGLVLLNSGTPAQWITVRAASGRRPQDRPEQHGLLSDRRVQCRRRRSGNRQRQGRQPPHLALERLHPQHHRAGDEDPLAQDGLRRRHQDQPEQPDQGRCRERLYRGFRSSAVDQQCRRRWRRRAYRGGPELLDSQSDARQFRASSSRAAPARS